MARALNHRSRVGENVEKYTNGKKNRTEHAHVPSMYTHPTRYTPDVVDNVSRLRVNIRWSFTIRFRRNNIYDGFRVPPRPRYYY